MAAAPNVVPETQGPEVGLDPISDAEEIEAGRKLFAQECTFFWGAAARSQLPPEGAPEIAFAGRSNVGKSSLLNALTGRKTLARTSHTPGRTQELNFFALGPTIESARMRLVDMPGYGYAAASKEKIAAWTSLCRDFLRGRVPLLRVYVLIDGRHGLKPIDSETLDLLDQSAISYQIVLTKRDEVKKSEQAARIASVKAALAKRPAAYPDVIFTSSQSGEGIADLRAAIARLLAQQTSGNAINLS
ncbi:ribosome biogenesis GTP-binding protein YihA/YsxC [Beijerinckia indica]|uniref:Probable GTP-binding protein EngB n=1 Tax=Beijerinckia indica subsp. indica (strain ATCC 9039 / DSM 1715 / NCIMB 8712) TaxID=395963 RepID=B2IDV6_BEII9|nr:ribosome biogenesis GTP-binding protein YihA/YsxC [Beijerinckia indica]ACB96888.1 GTP-binding protein HSR1-related [Beijerinckia indica subsp. indica ATCC 9039]